MSNRQVIFKTYGIFLPEMVYIDGSSGGGQMLRTALGLSCALGIPFEIDHIRAIRQKPGLAAQHLAAVRLAVQMTQATVQGDSLGSSTLSFTPGIEMAKQVEVDVGTAGSVTLLMQTLLPLCVFLQHPVRVLLKGGTDVPFAMPIDFFRESILRTLSLTWDMRIARGYYPIGGGSVELNISPLQRKPLRLGVRKEVHQLRIYSHASKDLMERQVAERQSKAAETMLISLKIPISVQSEYVQTACTGSGIGIFCICGDEDTIVMGTDSLGEQKKNALVVGQEAAQKMKELLSSSASVDVHTADTLIPLLGLLGGEITTESMTDHIRSNIAVTEAFLGKRFEIDGKKIFVDIPYLM